MTSCQLDLAPLTTALWALSAAPRSRAGAAPEAARYRLPGPGRAGRCCGRAGPGSGAGRLQPGLRLGQGRPPRPPHPPHSRAFGRLSAPRLRALRAPPGPGHVQPWEGGERRPRSAHAGSAARAAPGLRGASGSWPGMAQPRSGPGDQRGGGRRQSPPRSGGCAGSLCPGLGRRLRNLPGTESPRLPLGERFLLETPSREPSDPRERLDLRGPRERERAPLGEGRGGRAVGHRPWLETRSDNTPTDSSSLSRVKCQQRVDWLQLAPVPHGVLVCFWMFQLVLRGLG